MYRVCKVLLQLFGECFCSARLFLTELTELLQYYHGNRGQYHTRRFLLIYFPSPSLQYLLFLYYSLAMVNQQSTDSERDGFRLCRYFVCFLMISAGNLGYSYSRADTPRRNNFSSSQKLVLLPPLFFRPIFTIRIAMANVNVLRFFPAIEKTNKTKIIKKKKLHRRVPKFYREILVKFSIGFSFPVGEGCLRTRKNFIKKKKNSTRHSKKPMRFPIFPRDL